MRVKSGCLAAPSVELTSTQPPFPQAYTCFPWRTALENVEFGLALQPGRSTEEVTRIATEYLGKVGLAHRAHARPKELAGGHAAARGHSREPWRFRDRFC